MTTRKIRLGALCVGEYSFWPIWMKALTATSPLGAPIAGMEVTHCWDVNPEQAAGFGDQHGCEPVDRFDAMLGQVDAIAFGGLYEVPWQHLLARPYVDAGLPTYLSRPFAYSLRDIDSLLELAAKRNTPLMATNVFEHFPQATILRDRLSAIGKVKSAFGSCHSSEYPGHFHLPSFVHRVFGYDVEAVSLLTDDAWSCAYLQQTLLFSGNDAHPPFLASLHASRDVPYLSMRVIGDRGSDETEVTRSSDEGETLYHFFAPQIMAMQRTFQGNLFQPLDVIRRKLQIFLTGYYSHLERRGALVPVDELPADWSPPPPRPGWIDDSVFKL